MRFDLKRKRLAFAIAAGLLLSAGIAQADDSECDIDAMMTSNRISMDKMTTAVYEKAVGSAISSAPTVKEASCLPMLDTLDTLIRMRIPSTGSIIGGLMAKIRDMACKTANGFLASLAQRATANVSDPFGIVGVQVGATGGQNSGVETYDVTEVIGKAVENAGRNASSGAANDILNQLPKGPTNRNPRIENTVNDAVQGVVNGL